MSAFFIVAPLLFAAGGPSLACDPIPGWDAVLADTESRWLVIGEMHGNNEGPEIFADAVCLTAQVRPVVVGVEQPDADQAAIDAFLASDGGEPARRAFVAAPMWQRRGDGRASEANLRLFERLRVMKRAGQIKAVVAFVPSRFDPRAPQAEYEVEMANRLKAAAQSDATVVALTGNIHAMRTRVPWEPHYLPMAGHLPAGQTVTLDIVTNGGEAWMCQGQPVSCGPQPLPPSRVSLERGVVLHAGEDSRFSGNLAVGGASTASPPQQP